MIARKNMNTVCKREQIALIDTFNNRNNRNHRVERHQTWLARLELAHQIIAVVVPYKNEKQM